MWNDIISSLTNRFDGSQQESYKMRLMQYKNGNLRVIFTNSANSERVIFYLERITTLYGLTRFEIKHTIYKKRHEGFHLHFKSFLYSWRYYHKAPYVIIVG